jgi:phosphatidylserine/phosphatidylglycerophosphate/cardiolipin synthase-like enzyme
MKLFLALITVSIFSLASPAHAQLEKVCFSPSTCCEDNIVELIQNSQNTIDIVIYAITNHKIYDALKEAKSKGVTIKIVTDKTQSKGKSSLVSALINDGF